MSAAGAATSVLAPESLSRRYEQAYIFAAAIVKAGGIIKKIGLCLGGFVLLVSFVYGTQTRDGFLFFVLFLGACTVAVNGWILGMISQALGQIMLSVIDTAVNTSPLLDNQRKAQLVR